jgi:hypothetical protein
MILLSYSYISLAVSIILHPLIEEDEAKEASYAFSTSLSRTASISCKTAAFV